MDYSRRSFAALMLTLFSGPRRGAGSSADSPSILKRYRADAVILLLGIPLYKRAGVGSGQVSVEETGEGTQASRTLFFAAGSDAKRAHGFSRLGWMREIIHGPAAVPSEMEYFGVMTSSPEESLDSARKSAAAPPGGSSLFAAVTGRHTAGHSSSSLTKFEYSSEAPWSDPGLIAKAKSVFGPGAISRETSWPKSPNQSPPTFLFQLEALLKQRAKGSGIYVYNEQEYLLELGPPQQGGPADHLLAIKGSVRNQRTGNRTAFRVWIEKAPNPVIPVRIEFQPRSFLRLNFEAVAG
jgi:hypothetical protein